MLSKSDIKLTKKDYGTYSYELDKDLSHLDMEHNFRALTEAIIELQNWNDMSLAVSRGLVDGVSGINKFGRNSDVDAAEDLCASGGNYTPPTEARLHNIVSTSTEDAGTLLSTGTITEASLTKIIDSSATFITDTVSAGDVVVNDTSGDHSIVISVDSETQLTVEDMHHETINSIGDTYRVATSNGTGAVFTHISEGLNSNFGRISEFVLNNGTSNVATTKTFFRINRAHIHGTGSNKVNVGNISITAQTDATVTAYIPAGIGQTLQAFYTVPAGEDAYLKRIWANVNKASGAGICDITLRRRLWGDQTGDGNIVELYTSVSNDRTLNKVYDGVMNKYSEETDIWMRIENVTNANTDISGGFDLLLVERS